MPTHSKPGTPLSSSAKRPRASRSRDLQDESLLRSPYARLQNAHLPLEIRALPHILKQIDTFLMTDDEAVMEAVRTGDAKWLEDLLFLYNGDVVGAMLEASSHGHVDCVEVMLEEYERRELTDYNSWEGLLNAVTAAATNGHLEVLRLLLAEVSPGSDRLRKADLRGTTRGALLVAAERGHLDVVKLVVQHAKEKEYAKILTDSRALARAISGGQTIVVEYLLGLDELTWDLQEAFVAAVGAKDNSLADRLYELYEQTPKEEELFAWLARHGHLHAVKYLYETGPNDPVWIGEAFVQASRREGTKVLEFLLSTGQVSSDAFDKGLEMAVASLLDDVDVIAFLVEKKRASAKAINKVFVATSSCDILTVLLEHEEVGVESILTVFDKAVVDLNNPFSRTEKEDADIIELLYTKDCISAEMVGKAFVTAASNGKSKLVTLLRGDSRLSSRMVGEAFAAAATLEESHLMMTLFDANISADVILVAFSNAASRGRACNVKELARLLANKDRVPQEFKHKAFVIAAQLGHTAILHILCDGTDDYWPLAVLREALAAAKHEDVKTSIRKVICDQLLDPKCPWAPMVKLIEDQTSDSTDTSRVVT